MPAPDKPVVAIAQGDEDVVVEMKGSSFDQETSKKDTTTAEKVEELEPVPLSTIFSFSSFEDRALVAASFFAAICSGANQPAQLIIFGNILDAFNDPDPDKATRMINFLALCYLFVALQMFATSFTQTACISAAAGRQTKHIRERYFAALLRQDVGYFDRNDAGSLAASVMESTRLVEDGIGEKMALSVQFIAAFVFGLGTALYYVWELALLLCGVVPLIVAVIAILATRMTKSGEESAAAYNEAGGGAAEALGNIRTVLALGAEKRLAAVYRSKLVAAEGTAIKRWWDTAVMAGIIALVMWCTYALGLWFGSKLIADDMAAKAYCTYRTNADGDFEAPDGDRCITGGDVMICFFCVLFGGLNLGQAGPGIVALTLAKKEASKIFRIINLPSPIDPSSQEGEVPGGEPAKAKAAGASVAGHIEFRDVTFRYPMRPDVQVYNGLNLTIEPGETVALVGPSGCGKSTAVALLERFYDPQEGAVMLDGHDLKSLRLSWLRQQIGLVSQEPVLFSGSIFENIAAGKGGGGGGGDEEGGALATMAEVEEAAKLANAHTFITSADFPDGYQTQVGEKGTQLSGGQKQRIAIARAIVRDPSILILDEATSALDTASERVVQAALDGLLKAKKRTTLVIAHRLSTIRNADKIVVLMDGSVVEVGTHDSLMGPSAIGHYRDLVSSATGKIE